ncbi:MAG: hypothetical protein MJE68_31395 [Proteobacteria bacterium]|nr:hypothetical protein [Pseudomonadota bacterium]
MATLAERIFGYLKDNPNERFTALAIAEDLGSHKGIPIPYAIVHVWLTHFEPRGGRPSQIKRIEGYPLRFFWDAGGRKATESQTAPIASSDANKRVAYTELAPDKRAIPPTKTAAESQVATTSSDANKDALHTDSKTMPESQTAPTFNSNANEGVAGEAGTAGQADSNKFTEADLYPKLVDYLYFYRGLYSMIIDASTTPNIEGRGANKWRHPDIVAMQNVTTNWDYEVKTLAKEAAGRMAKLWSFEVKKELNPFNLRESFFQAVFNSSWANFGYLVAAEVISDTNGEMEMLSEVHGIGVIKLNPVSPEESQIIIPAREKNEVNWEAVTLLAKNGDFKEFIRAVQKFYQTGDPRNKIWEEPTNGWADQII